MGGWQVVPRKRGREELPVALPSEEVSAACRIVADRWSGVGDQAEGSECSRAGVGQPDSPGIFEDIC